MKTRLLALRFDRPANPVAPERGRELMRKMVAELEAKHGKVTRGNTSMTFADSNQKV